MTAMTDQPSTHVNEFVSCFTFTIGNITGRESKPYRVRTFHMQVIYLIISSVGLPGNILSACVIVSSPSMRRKPINIFIVSQSCIDFGVCLTSLLLPFKDSLEGIPKGWVSTF